MTLDRFFPFLHWARRYGRDDLQGDLIAGVIVTLMLIPQSLAYAMLADLPPVVGLYASTVPLLAYALFGSSRTLAVGPVAVVSLMTAAAIGQVAAPGTPEAVGAALLLASLSGLVLLALGLLRLGFLANLLSHPVVSGFISASAIMIAVSQMKHVLGVAGSGGAVYEQVYGLVRQLPETNPVTAAIGFLALAWLFWVRRGLARVLQDRLGWGGRLADVSVRAAPVLVVALSTLVVHAFSLAQRSGVAVVGSFPAGLPPLTLPPLDATLAADLLPAAILIAIVGFVESVSVAQALAAKRRQHIDPDQELIGLGAANLAAGFTGGYPVTGGFARSGVNFAAGARTPLAGVLTAILIGVIALVATPLFRDLPNAVLAATIIVAVLSLVDLGKIGEVFRYSTADGLAMAATIVGVLALGIELGIVIGIALSLAIHIYRTSRPHIAVVGRVPGTEHYRNVERHKVLTDPRVLAIRVDESLYFPNARFLEERVMALVAKNPKVERVVLVCSAVNLIDASAIESLEALIHHLRDAGVAFDLAEVKGPVMDRLQTSHIFPLLDGRIHLSTHAAMMAGDRPAGTPAAA